MHDGNGDAVVQDPPADLRCMMQLDDSVDSARLMINEDPGPAPVLGDFYKLITDFAT